jgi:hypothetical protein
LRRAARYEGWQPNPTDFDFDEVAPLFDYLRQQPAFAGKGDSFDLYWLKPPAGAHPPIPFTDASAAARSAYRDQLLDGFKAFAAQGVTRTPVPLPPTRSQYELLEYLEWFDEEVAPRVDG